MKYILTALLLAALVSLTPAQEKVSGTDTFTTVKTVTILPGVAGRSYKITHMTLSVDGADSVGKFQLNSGLRTALAGVVFSAPGTEVWDYNPEGIFTVSNGAPLLVSVTDVGDTFTTLNWNISYKEIDNLPTNRFYFSAAGDNANTGTSPDWPQQNINGANSEMREGNQLFFKRGETFTGTTTGLEVRFGGTTENPLSIGAYGDPALARPIISVSGAPGITAEVGGTDWVTVSNIEIDDGTHGIDITSSSNWLVSNCLINGYNDDGIAMNGSGQNIRIAGCIFDSYRANSAINVRGDTSKVRIDLCGFQYVGADTGTASSVLSGGLDTRISRCVFDGEWEGNSLVVSKGTTEVFQCWFKKSSGCAVNVQGVASLTLHNSILRADVLDDPARAGLLFIEGNASATVYNCTMLQKTGAQTYGVIVLPSASLTFANNILEAVGSTASSILLSSLTPNYRGANNIYWPDAAARFQLNTFSFTFAQWAGATTQYTSNLSLADPLLTDTAGDDEAHYALGAGSPAIRGGLRQLGQPIADYFNSKWGFVPDVGAIRYE